MDRDFQMSDPIFFEYGNAENGAEWEDVAMHRDYQPSVHRSLRSGRTSPSPSSTPRKRRQGKTVHTTGSRRLVMLKTRRPVQPLMSQAEAEIAVTQSIRSSAVYIYNLVAWTFYLLKIPLIICLAGWTIYFVLCSVLRELFSPLCAIPGLSLLPVCTRQIYTADRPNSMRINHADYPKMVEMQTRTFELLLDDQIGQSGLTLDVKKAEMATRDLLQLVRISQLTSKHLLAEILEEFVEDARNTGIGLSKLNSRINGAVDQIIAVNDYASQMIEAAQSNPKGSASLVNFIWPFRSLTTSSETLLTSTFEQSLSVLSGNLGRMIISAESSLYDLDKLEEALNTIHSILVREDVSISSQKSEVLADLWTFLGRNRDKLRQFENNLNLLKALSIYRTRALAQVVAALHALRTLNSDMEELRDRVIAPEIVGGAIPIEVHVQSIKRGIDRLKEGQERAKRMEREKIRSIVDSDSYMPLLSQD